jgi:hypothetical protein
MQGDLATKLISPSTDDRVGDAFICSLHTKLPEAAFRECVERLAQRKNVMAVARWLMKQERGGLKDVGVHTLRKYLGELNKRVQAIKQKSPVIEQSLVQHLEIHERRVENDAAICGVAAPNKHERVQACEEKIAGVVQWMSSRRVFALALVHTIDEMALVKGVEKKMPIPMTDSVLKLVRELHVIGVSLAKLEQQTHATLTRGEGCSNEDAEPEEATLTAVSTGDALKQEIAKLNPAQYDKTLNLGNVLEELIDLKQQVAEHKAAIKPEGTPDGQS